MIREFSLDRDKSALAALLSAARGKTITPSDVEGMFRRDAALDDFRALISKTAYARTFRQPSFPPGLHAVSVTVHPDAQRRGIGTTMLAAITDIARTLGATAQLCAVPDGRPAAMAFALNRGFIVDRHMAKSTADPTTIDPALLTVPPPPGITITSLAALGDTSENRHSLWQIYHRVAADFPNERRQPPTYEQFTRQLLDAPGFRPAGAFAALDGEVWAGAATVGHDPARNALYHHFTGVTPPYRGRGIATALRRATITYAKKTAAAILETHNDSANTPILAINRAFGYHQEPGLTDLHRQLKRR